MNEYIQKHQHVLTRLGIVVLILLGIFLLVATVAKLKEYRYIGSGLPVGNTISVTGQGSVERSPDTARVSFTVRNEAKEVATAQTVVSDKIDAVTESLKTAGIDKDDISTERYNSNPQYNYPQGGVAPVLRGYEVSQVVTVKISDLALVETVVGILGQNGVSDIQGPNFGFDDDKAVAREARELAIKDAKEQAKKLADDLGVDLVRIVSFNESGNAMPVPMYRSEMMAAQDSKAGSSPSIPVGTTDIDSSVTIVYEIR